MKYEPITEREKIALELQKEFEECQAFDQKADFFTLAFDEAVSLRLAIARVCRKDRHAGQMIVDELMQVSKEVLS